MTFAARAASAPTQAPIPRALPRAPVLDWSSFHRGGPPERASLETAAHRAFTSSGRAAIYHALLQLRLPPASTVLVASYHCPRMVAPIICAGHRPAFFPIAGDGLPNLERIDRATRDNSRAIIVAHYFGLPRSLDAVRRWCDAHGIALIEDCAHCYFGQAGERPVGHWGDYAAASLSKFFPVPEAGLLVSAHRPMEAPPLRAPRWIAQLKGCVDVLEVATQHARLRGLDHLLGPLFALKRRRSLAGTSMADIDAPIAAADLASCDMGRVDERPLWISHVLASTLPRGRIAARRRDNYAAFTRHFSDTSGARPLYREALHATDAPYVFPLWVDDADRIYHRLREARYPVFRWDQLWPSTPQLEHDVGARWSRHVLQLLCHQDLDAEDIDRVATKVIALCKASVHGGHER